MPKKNLEREQEQNIVQQYLAETATFIGSSGRAGELESTFTDYLGTHMITPGQAGRIWELKDGVLQGMEWSSVSDLQTALRAGKVLVLKDVDGYPYCMTCTAQEDQEYYHCKNIDQAMELNAKRDEWYEQKGAGHLKPTEPDWLDKICDFFAGIFLSRRNRVCEIWDAHRGLRDLIAASSNKELSGLQMEAARRKQERKEELAKAVQEKKDLEGETQQLGDQLGHVIHELAKNEMKRAEEEFIEGRENNEKPEESIDPKIRNYMEMEEKMEREQFKKMVQEMDQTQRTALEKVLKDKLEQVKKQEKQKSDEYLKLIKKRNNAKGDERTALEEQVGALNREIRQIKEDQIKREEQRLEVIRNVALGLIPQNKNDEIIKDFETQQKEIKEELKRLNESKEKEDSKPELTEEEKQLKDTQEKLEKKLIEKKSELEEVQGKIDLLQEVEDTRKNNEQQFRMKNERKKEKAKQILANSQGNMDQAKSLQDKKPLFVKMTQEELEQEMKYFPEKVKVTVRNAANADIRAMLVISNQVIYHEGNWETTKAREKDEREREQQFKAQQEKDAELDRRIAEKERKEREWKEKMSQYEPVLSREERMHQKEKEKQQRQEEEKRRREELKRKREQQNKKLEQRKKKNRDLSGEGNGGTQERMDKIFSSKEYQERSADAQEQAKLMKQYQEQQKGQLSEEEREIREDYAVEFAKRVIQQEKMLENMPKKLQDNSLNRNIALYEKRIEEHSDTRFNWQHSGFGTTKEDRLALTVVAACMAMGQGKWKNGNGMAQFKDLFEYNQKKTPDPQLQEDFREALNKLCDPNWKGDRPFDHPWQDVFVPMADLLHRLPPNSPEAHLVGKCMDYLLSKDGISLVRSMGTSRYQQDMTDDMYVQLSPETELLIELQKEVREGANRVGVVSSSFVMKKGDKTSQKAVEDVCSSMLAHMMMNELEQAPSNDSRDMLRLIEGEYKDNRRNLSWAIKQNHFFMEGPGDLMEFLSERTWGGFELKVEKKIAENTYLGREMEKRKISSPTKKEAKEILKKSEEGKLL